MHDRFSHLIAPLVFLLVAITVAVELMAHSSPLWGPLLALQGIMLAALVLLVVREMRERRQAKVALAESEQRYQLLAEQASEVVWAVNMQCDVVYLSPSIYSLLGYTRAEMAALTWAEREAAGVDAALQQELRAAIAALQAGRPPNRPPTTTQQRHRNGRTIWTETNIDALYDDEGAPVGLRAVVRDISKRMAALEALRRSEERFARMVQANPAGIALTRLDDGCYLDANDAYLEMVGYSRDELIGRTGTELGIVTPQERNKIVSAIQQQGFVHDFDVQIHGKDGKPVEVRFATEPLEMGGEPCLLSTMIDVGASKRLERELRQVNEELEERVASRTADLQTALGELRRALVLRDEFMAMISHELRTPLTGVLAMAEMLEAQVAGALTPRQAVYVGNIQTSGERLLRVVNTILSYTQVLAGTVHVNPEPCALASLLETAASSVRTTAANKRQSLSITVTPPDLTIVSDRQALVQVMRLLLDNAVKFTPEGGRLGIEVQPLGEPCSAGQAAYVDIAVWDTGPGIGNMHLAELVKPFVQADGRLSRQHEGMGMGLAYVHRLLPYLGGDLRYAPNPGGGSRFLVSLPCSAAP
jgi:PAS domain S-box-containing protein